MTTIMEPGLLSRRHLLAMTGTTFAAGRWPTGSALPTTLTVRDGQTVTLDRSRRLRRLVVDSGGVLTTPTGKVLTLVVDGVETGTTLIGAAGETARIAAGDYRGAVVLAVTDQNPVAFQGLDFPFRQALYVGRDGPDAARSVSDAWLGGRVGTAGADELTVASTGEVFNGVYVNQGRYLLHRPRIEFSGNGRCDFVGYGAALTATGTEARLTVEGARIVNRGVVRTAVVVDGGSTVVVKDSLLHTADGVLPTGYVPTVDMRTMRAAPWMLGLSGTVRTTVLVGQGSTAAYIRSDLSSEGWGVLSSDLGSGCRLAAINSRVAITGASGYGSYAIGDATEHLLGTDVDVADYASVVRGGTVHYGDSTTEAVSALNRDWDLGLTEPELAAIFPRPCTVRSRRFGVMWHGPGTARIDGGTVFHTADAVFLIKGQPVQIAVDGSAGAQLRPGNGILLQVIDNDDPGLATPAAGSGTAIDAFVYHEPAGRPGRVRDFGTTVPHATDAVATLTDLELTGDFFNGVGGGTPSLAGQNLGLTLIRSRLTGRVSASVARHPDADIGPARARELGVVTNLPSPVVNNGVLVTLGPGSRWSPTGTCHLSALHLDPTATLAAPAGRELAMSVNGRSIQPVPGGSWTGTIEISVR